MTRYFGKNLTELVHRTKTLDRRRGYITPSPPDTKCPGITDTWVMLKDKGVVPDYVPVCSKHDGECAYRRVILPNQFNLCHRYIKEDNDGFTPTTLSGTTPNVPHQTVNLTYKLIRLFLDKYVNVRMRTARLEKFYKSLLNTSNVEEFSNFPTPVGALAASSYVSGMEKEANYSFVIDLSATTFEAGAKFETIFRYNPETKHYYSLEWTFESSGTTVIVKKHICTNKNTNTYTSTILWSGTFLISSYGQNRIQVTVSGVRASIMLTNVYRTWTYFYYNSYWSWYWWYYYGYGDTNGGYWSYITQSFPITIDLSDDRLNTGTYGYGLFTSSSTYVAGFSGDVLLQGSYEYVSKNIPLAPHEISGAGRIVSAFNMEDSFKEERDAYMRTYGLTRSEILGEGYDIMHHNVTEGLVFSNGAAFTSNPLNKMKNLTWNYDIDFQYQKELVISGETHSVTTDVYHVQTDLYVKGIEVDFDHLYMDDGFDFLLDTKELYHTMIGESIYKTDYIEGKFVQVMNDITFNYEMQRDPLKFFSNEIYIDTHDKQYRIEENKAGWHKDEVV